MADVDMMAVPPVLLGKIDCVCVRAPYYSYLAPSERERERGESAWGRGTGDVGVVGGTTSISGSYIPTPYIYIYLAIEPRTMVS